MIVTFLLNVILVFPRPWDKKVNFKLSIILVNHVDLQPICNKISCRPNQDFLCFYPYENIRIHHECEGGTEISVLRITNWHHKACEEQIFLSHPHINNDFFLAQHYVPHFVFEKHENGFQEILNSLRCDIVTSTCGCSFLFYLSHGLV